MEGLGVFGQDTDELWDPSAGCFLKLWPSSWMFDAWGQCNIRLTVAIGQQCSLWPVSNYTGLWQRHMCVNNLPRCYLKAKQP